MVSEGKSYLKASRQLISEPRNLKVEVEDIRVTIDINSLYTNIIQKDGISSLEWALHRQTDLQQEQIKYIMEGLRLAMSHNYFWHKGEYYTQTKGVAMGAKYAPSVANLFLNRWEEEQIYSVRRDNLKLYQRYIDDIVIVWKDREEELQTFFEEINQSIYGITFTGNWSRQSIDYLDLQIYKNNGNLGRRFLKPWKEMGIFPPTVVTIHNGYGIYPKVNS